MKNEILKVVKVYYCVIIHITLLISIIFNIGLLA